MAYVAPSYDEIRQGFLNDPSRGPPVTPPSFVGTGGGEGGGTPSLASGSAPAPGGSGRFAALQGFFSANAPNADARATAIAQPFEASAQQAVSKADESSRLPENYGGLESAAAANSAKEDALSGINAASTQAGVGELVGKNRGADYTPGAKAADSFLYGRSSAFQNLQKWAPVMNALDPSYQPSYTWEAPGDERLISAPQGGGRSTLGRIGDEAKKILTSPIWDW